MYDDENRLTSLTYPTDGGPVTDTYQWNALGQRMRATLDGTVLRYVYHGERVLQETDDAGTERWRHITESGSYYDPFLYTYCPESTSGTWRRFPMYDGVGTVHRLLNEAGYGAHTYWYDSFGRIVYEHGAQRNPYRFGGAWGYMTDPSGMLQLGARFYWPEIGRFIQQDPIADGINWYAYVGNNPVVWVDTEGLHETGSTWHNLGHWRCTWVPGLKQGAAILADTVNVFGNPYKDAGVYDPTDPYIAAAQASAAIGVAAGATATGLGIARWAGVEVNVLSKGNIFKVITRRFRAGFRIDPAHHGKRWGHGKFWRW